MIALLLVAAHPVIDAERAFAAAAQRGGQWAAFRATATADALLFVPEQVRAQDWLKDRKEPKTAIQWWPAAAYIACDGKTAATTGPAAIPRVGYHGYYTSIWQRQPEGGWKWVFDHGADLAKPRAAGDRPIERRASCKGKPRPAKIADETGMGMSADKTLLWRWTVAPDLSRRVEVYLWNGRDYAHVITDYVPKP